MNRLNQAKSCVAYLYLDSSFQKRPSLFTSVNLKFNENKMCVFTDCECMCTLSDLQNRPYILRHIFRYESVRYCKSVQNFLSICFFKITVK